MNKFYELVNELVTIRIPVKLQYVIAMLIAVLASPMVVYAVQGKTSIDSSILSPILITGLTIAYAWGIWIIRSAARTDMTSAQETAYQIEALNAHSIVTMADAHGDLIFVNEKFLETTGYNRSDLLGKSKSMLYPDSERLLFKEIQNIIQSGNSWEGEMQVKSKDGTNVWTNTTIVPQLDNRKNVIGSISIRTDITQSKITSADKYLRKSLHLLRDEVYMFDPITLQFLYLNEAAMKQCGWDETTYIDKILYDAHIEMEGPLPIDPSQFFEMVRPLTDGEVDEMAFELLFQGKLNEVKLQLVQTEGGKPHFVAMARDISERKAFEKTKDDFISTVSHELRTPVTSIKGALGLILSGATGSLDEKAKRMLDIAYRNTDRLTLIINDILDLEKIAAGRMDFNFEPVSMSNLVADAIAANEAYADRYNVSVKTFGLDQDLEGYCDGDRIFQVMNNLLSNAAKFSNTGGEVHVSLFETNTSVCISVEDFGEGIPLEAQSSIFNRFMQADSSDRRSKGGTGLGLSIVKALVESQGGSIGFTSQVGKGSKFSFDIPKTYSTATVIPVGGIRQAAE